MSTQPTADQPLVTHADLLAITALDNMPCPREFNESTRQAVSDFLIRLRAAAEADKPALPEGWVLADGAPRWHDGKGRIAFSRRHAPSTTVSDWESVTPLVTAASLVPEGWHVDEDGDGRPTVWDGDDEPIVGKVKNGNPSPVFDVLAAFVYAAQAERGESR